MPIESSPVSYPSTSFATFTGVAMGSYFFPSFESHSVIVMFPDPPLTFKFPLVTSSPVVNSLLL